MVDEYGIELSDPAAYMCMVASILESYKCITTPNLECLFVVSLVPHGKYDLVIGAVRLYCFSQGFRIRIVRYEMDDEHCQVLIKAS